MTDTETIILKGGVYDGALLVMQEGIERISFISRGEEIGYRRTDKTEDGNIVFEGEEENESSMDIN